MADFVYPTAVELNAVAQDLMPRLQQNRPIFDIMPVRDVDAALLLWEQMDNYTGLQQVRGLDGDATRVKKTGVKRYMMEPGVYGEYENIDEQDLTTRRNIGSFQSPIDISDLVMMSQAKLLQRRLDRIEQIGWTLLSTGTFSVSGPSGAVLHTDTFSNQTFTAGTPWSTAATSTPLADLRSVKVLHRGHSINFGTGAKAYVNQTTMNEVLINTNSADIFGRRVIGLATANSGAAVNQLLAGDDLPQFVVYDEGYIDDAGNFQLWIPANTAIVVGQRPAGQVVGEYRMTRNANNPNLAPGPYMKVIDTGERQVPRNIQVHDGHNGGPVLYFPSAVVIMNV